MEKEMINNIAQLCKLFTDNRCVLYGAGMVAKTVVKYASIKQYAIEEIFVSDMQGNPPDIMGVPVHVIADFGITLKSRCLIVCMMEDLHVELQQILQNYEFKNIYYISNELLRKITYEIGDYEIAIIQLLKDIKKNLFDINRKLDAKNVFWYENKDERIFVKENWGMVVEDTDFKSKYLKLIQGLDSQSVETIVRIIKRQTLILKCEDKKIDLFTCDEKEKIRNLQESFYPLILKLQEDLFSYKNYLLPCNHFEASVFYYKHGINNIKNIERIKGKNVLDVGGFIGDSALVLSELEPTQIYSFEALPQHFKLMKETIRLNNMNNVTLVNTALGRSKGTVTMNICGSGTTYIDRKGIAFEGKIDVPVVSLDEYVEENAISDIGLIKVDIEGSEPDFLIGAKETISKYTPVLLVSIYHNAHDFFELKPMIEEWNLGYKFSIFKSVNGNITNETLLIAEVY